MRSGIGFGRMTIAANEGGRGSAPARMRSEGTDVGIPSRSNTSPLAQAVSWVSNK